MIIGITGKSEHGKDTAARYLRQRYGFAPKGFADKLKEAAGVIFDFRHEQLWTDKKDTLDLFWGETPGAILQKLGTAVRESISQDVWARSLIRDLNLQDDWVITDVRYPNEADAIVSLGGKIVRVYRPNHVGKRPASHASETAMDKYPCHMILNTGSINDLNTEVDRFMATV